PSLAAVTYGNLIFLGVASTLAWVVARRRMPAPYAAGFTVFAAVLVVSVRALGRSSWDMTYAMLYNRFGWVLYATLLVLVLLRPRGPFTPRILVVEGLVLGGLLGLLFYCKANFFLVGIGAVAVGLALSRLARSMALGLWGVVGFLAVAVIMRLAFGVRTLDYLTDLAAAARAQDSGLRLSTLAHSVVDNSPVALLTVRVIGGLLVSGRRRGGATSRLWRLAVAAGYVLGSSVVVSAANTPEKSELPALVVIPLLLIDYRAVAPARLVKPLLIGLAGLLLA